LLKQQLCSSTEKTKQNKKQKPKNPRKSVGFEPQAPEQRIEQRGETAWVAEPLAADHRRVVARATRRCRCCCGWLAL
jgi:hypothetical protein